MSEIHLDWNVIVEVTIGVILYKIIDSIINITYRLIKKFIFRIH